MKYLLLFAVLFIAYLIWRNNRLDRNQAAPRPGARPGQPQQMVSCQACGVHLPQSDALPGPEGQFYCCPEHRGRAGG
jgi:uncharacterized protein